ncbi:molybdopterin molybdotransferase MoeA [Sphingosinicella rhizophila]|uniref:Molybdopterin molybdenumtransferase n=1 Tax=Sphingosinicella rhizophila TaxID=3050082 RepID=A0ABU3Q5V8_9SPHN|nr:molybdopterin molybdotransferase MoeA [Sphingosinicella sp. GR2756]MDT9598785.1 molybdopterin molybdotransferase MoeA [Sphingosinicella sp. GR2756]
MIGYDEAQAIVAGAARPLASEMVPLAAASGRFLAAAVVANVASPPADVSAMDGYATSGDDLPSFTLVGISYPGNGFAGRIGAGECVRIFTGAPVPEGAKRVIVQEIVRTDGSQIVLVSPPGSATHIRPRGSDFMAGEQLLPAGRQLDPRALVAAAGADLATAEIWSRPRIVILTTGDELVEAGTARATPGAIPESVSLGVSALAEQYGGHCVSRRRLRDEPQEIKEASERALAEADLVVMTGGASVGEKDYAKPVFQELGLELEFSKVAIKPGKPIWFGRARGKLVMGLPGNPTSAMITGRLFLAPLVRGLAGGDPAHASRWRHAPLVQDMPPCGDRETFVRGRWRGDGVEAVPNQDSSAQRALAEAEILIRRRPGAPAVAAGQLVEIIDL